ncbi:MAG TPA: peptidylprolyl isomerase [Gemmataceae bacterium]|nr:peptidylprolyl isomerase [Gemmataceae bacterium]
MALTAGFLALVVGAYFLGRCATLPVAAAQGVEDSKSKSDSTTHHPLTSHQDVASSRQVVAYIHGSIPITREDLAEYLIARQGAERLELMVNHRIIELACQKKGIVVTDAEIDAALAESLKRMNIPSVKDFVNQILKKNQATLYEYRVDVLWAKLALAKMIRSQVQVTEDDIRKAFEAYHGEKVQCQMIMWPAEEEKRVMTEVYPKIRDSAEEFDRVAKYQAAAHLASAGGHVEPFARHTTGNEELEKEAFGLRPGEISKVFQTPQGLVVVKCLKHIEADKTAVLDEKERAKLEKECMEKKVQLEFPLVFKRLRDEANPQLFLGKHAQTEEELTKAAKEALTSDATPGLPTHAPKGN